VTERGAEEVRHLDMATLATLGARERSLLVHVAICPPCRRRLATAERDEHGALTAEAAASAAFRQLLRELEAEAGFQENFGAMAHERREAAERVRELHARPDSWGTAAAEPRYASLAVACQLLAAAEDEEPLMALRLLDLAREIAVVVTADVTANAPEASLGWQLFIAVRCARVHRLLDIADRAGAVRELRRAARLLEPQLGYGRALYCRALARLRREQRRWEEALALAERAAVLLDDHGSTIEAGQAQIEQGWTLIDAGDPNEAQPVFEAALPLVEGKQSWAVTGHLGLAVALAKNGDVRGARRLLAAADRLTAAVPQPVERLRLRWWGAQTARRCGQTGSALRRLCRVVPALLAQGEDREAAAALLELLALCLERQWHEALGMTMIQVAIDALLESSHLHHRARAVFVFVAYVLADPGPRCAAEVVAAASRYLIASRYRPDLPFRPTRARPLIHLPWDEIDPRVRASICVEVGAGEETGRLPGNELDEAQREFISWRFEVLRRVRLDFPAPGHQGPPAA
jgi:tetratricopeptide (TPR) repeat protein